MELSSLRPNVLGRRSAGGGDFDGNDGSGACASSESTQQRPLAPPPQSQQTPVPARGLGGGLEWLRSFWGFRRAASEAPTGGRPPAPPRVGRRRTRYAPVGGELLQVRGGTEGLDEGSGDEDAPAAAWPRESSSSASASAAATGGIGASAARSAAPSPAAAAEAETVDASTLAETAPASASAFSRALQRVQMALMHRRPVESGVEAAARTPEAAASAAETPSAEATTPPPGPASAESRPASEGFFARIWRESRERLEAQRERAAAAALERREFELREAEEFGPDDPTCQQLLLVGGVVCWSPLLWLLGALLFIATPHSHVRARKVRDPRGGGAEPFLPTPARPGEKTKVVRATRVQNVVCCVRFSGAWRMW